MTNKDCKNCIHYDKRNLGNSDGGIWEFCSRFRPDEILFCDDERTIGNCGVEGKYFEEVKDAKTNLHNINK